MLTLASFTSGGKALGVVPHTPNADIYAVYPQRHQVTARVRAFVDFLALSLARS